MQFTFDGFIAPKSGSLDINKITVIIGSESKGTLNIGRLLAALVGTNVCKDPYMMFKRGLGKGIPELFAEKGFAKFEGVEVKKLNESLEIKRGEVPLKQVRMVPASRFFCIKGMAKVAELPFDLSFIASFLAEIVLEPVKFFINDLLGNDMCKVEKLSYVTREDLKRIFSRLGLDKDGDLTVDDVDNALFKYYSNIINRDELIVFEEPSVFKTLREAVDEMKNAIMSFYSKGAYVLIETTRMATIYAVNNLVSSGKIKAEDISAYHVVDGGIEELEIVEDVGITLGEMKLAADLAE